MLSVLNDEEEKWLAGASTIPELSEIAISSLRRMPQPVIQVCGPMSTGGRGSFEENNAFFYEAIQFLHNFGFFVFDSVRFQAKIIEILNWRRSDRRYRKEILYHFYGPVMDSGLLACAFFLPDWHTSMGAVWERSRALFSEHMYVIDLHPTYVACMEERYVARKILRTAAE